MLVAFPFKDAPIHPSDQLRSMGVRRPVYRLGFGNNTPPLLALHARPHCHRCPAKTAQSVRPRTEVSGNHQSPSRQAHVYGGEMHG